MHRLKTIVPWGSLTAAAKKLNLTYYLIIIWLFTFINGSTAPFWALAAFSVLQSYTQSVRQFGWGVRPSQGLYLHTGQHKHRINAHRHPCLSEIRTHDPPPPPVFERAKTIYALERTATVFGNLIIYLFIIKIRSTDSFIQLYICYFRQ
jgi:hypothetical protein